MLSQDRSVPHLQTSALYPFLANCKERNSSPGGLSQSSPCHPAAKKSPVKQGQDGGRLPGCSSQSRGLARAAADLEGGVERKGREDTRVSRHCLRVPLGLPVGGANSVPLQMFLFPRETSQRICVPQQSEKWTTVPPVLFILRSLK